MMPIEVPFNRSYLPTLFRQLGYRTGAEIGVRRGSFSLQLCLTIPGLRLTCVDAWTQYPTSPQLPSQARQESNYRETVEKLKGYDVKIMRAMSMDAVKIVPFESLDFVYVDAHHGYSYVMEDIVEWSQRVHPNGIISGDDYDAPGVRQAVDECVGRNFVNTWYTTKPPRVSWFWLRCGVEIGNDIQLLHPLS